MLQSNQPGFLIYCGRYEQIAMLSDTEAGQLFKALFKEFNGEDIPELSPMASLMFSVIRNDMRINSKHYEEVVKKRSEAGKKSAQLRRESKPQKAYGKHGKVLLTKDEYDMLCSRYDDYNIKICIDQIDYNISRGACVTDIVGEIDKMMKEYLGGGLVEV